MKKILLSCFVLFGVTSVECINITLLKGTHTIVPANYSPVMGLLFIEWDIARQWYELSPKYQAAQLKELLAPQEQALAENAEAVKLIENIGNNNATQNLIMLMFHISGGTFNVTNADDNPVKYFKPKHIGIILKVVDTWLDVLTSKDKINTLLKGSSEKKAMLEEEAKKTLIHIINLKKVIKSAKAQEITAEKSTSVPTTSNLKQESEQTLLQLTNQLEQKNEEIKRLTKILQIMKDPTSPDALQQILQLELSEVCKSFKLQNEKNKSFFTGNDFMRFIKSLAGSVAESIGSGASYANNTPQGILLGYMLKISNTKNDLQDYFRGFLGNDSFVLSSQEEYTIADIDHILKASVDASDFKQVADLLSAYTYQEKYNAPFPKVVDNKQVNYRGIDYQDCMDTAIRMLTNIVTYKKSEARVGVAPEGLKLNSQAVQFYASEGGLCAQSSEVGNSKVHQAWTEVVENIVGCSYANIGDGYGHNITSESIKLYDGVMPVIDVPRGLPHKEIEIHGKKYQLPIQTVGPRMYLLVPQALGLVCAEMMPNVSNILVSMNHIFELQLFDTAAIFEPTFVSTYFKALCDKFGWNVFIPDFKVLDSKQDIDITLGTASGSFTIHVYDRRHGYVTTQNRSQLDIKLTVPDTTSESVIVALVGARLVYVDTLIRALRKPYFYKYVSALNYDERNSIFGSILSKDSLTEVDKKYAQSLLISFCLNADPVYLTNIINSNHMRMIYRVDSIRDCFLGALQIHNIMYRSKIIFNYLDELIDKKLVTTEQAIIFIEQGMSLDYDIRSKLLDIVTNFMIDKDVSGKSLISAEQGLSLINNAVNEVTIVQVIGIIQELIQVDVISAQQGLAWLESMVDYYYNYEHLRSDNFIGAVQLLLNTLLWSNKLIDNNELSQIWLDIKSKDLYPDFNNF
ncbi:DUF4200 domain-containing protein [Candidatus Babeliales bacterium]|nr:DUF4200 domain-containing protein [Candidatus Babeliales bacterium]